MTVHYVECHVVVHDDKIGRSFDIAKHHGWWGARLSMDTSGEEQPSDVILTTRVADEKTAINSIREMKTELESYGLVVIRGKAEVAVFDTKMGDKL